MSTLHDLSDDAYWRSLTPRQVLDLVTAELADTYDGTDYPGGPDPIDVIRGALQTVGEDIQDRAVDLSFCNKVDACTGKAAFLAWLAWHLDDGFLARFEADAVAHARHKRTEGGGR